MTISQANPPAFRSDGGDDPSIVPVGPDLLPEAVSRLVSASADPSTDAAERFLVYARQNQIDLGLMFAALDREGRVEATALAVPNPGRTAMIFANRVLRPWFSGVARQVHRTAQAIDAACAAAKDRAGVRIAQTLLEPRERSERESYEAAGFENLANLSYLQRLALARPGDHTAVDWPDEVSLETSTVENEEDFVLALERSYEGTLDCPNLCGLRETADILAGHRATGAMEPQLWTLLRIADEPVGVLLLNPSPPQQSMELVYLGLAPVARGRGLGAMLLRHGLLQTAARPERIISLAVDECNTPAMRLYLHHGFRRLLRRVAMIRVL